MQHSDTERRENALRSAKDNGWQRQSVVLVWVRRQRRARALALAVEGI